MTIDSFLEALSKYARKRRSKPFAISFPFTKKKKDRTVGDKKKTDRIEQLEETVQSQAELLAELTKTVSTLRRQFDDVKEMVYNNANR